MSAAKLAQNAHPFHNINHSQVQLVEYSIELLRILKFKRGFIKRLGKFYYVSRATIWNVTRETLIN